VRYSGVRVGEVISVDLDPDRPTAIRVTIEVQKRTPVRADSLATLELEGLTGGRYVQLEGKERPRNVVAKFPSVEAAETCYHSPEYQEALSHARGASERELVIVETSE